MGGREVPDHRFSRYPWMASNEKVKAQIGWSRRRTRARCYRDNAPQRADGDVTIPHAGAGGRELIGAGRGLAGSAARCDCVARFLPYGRLAQ